MSWNREVKKRESKTSLIGTIFAVWSCIFPVPPLPPPLQRSRLLPNSLPIKQYHLKGGRDTLEAHPDSACLCCESFSSTLQCNQNKSATLFPVWATLRQVEAWAAHLEKYKNWWVVTPPPSPASSFITHLCTTRRQTHTHIFTRSL